MKRLGAAELKAMLLGAVETVSANLDTLTKLDSAIGDGDHGLAMGRAMEALRHAVADDQQSPSAMLFQAGWGVMSIDGGSTGPLLGSFFTGMSEVADESGELDADGVVRMMATGADHLSRNTKAAPGDKTMIDALLPAVDAMAACSGRDDIVELLEAAAQAAQDGAESTRSMTARFGRARNLGERAVGHVDPGAMSMALMFRGFVEGLKGAARST